MADNFAELPDKEKKSVCQLPLAHPKFAFVLVLLWTLTCVAHLRKTLDLCRSLLMYTQTAPLQNCIQEDEGETSSWGSLLH